MEIRRLAPGDRVLDYRILERLGEGGFGEVFRAEHEVLGKIVAIKVPHDQTGLTALRHEGVVQARLDHENIVTTRELSISHDPPFVVMDFIDGDSLAELLRREGPLSWRRATRILIAAGRALEHAHDRGVVHGDVKPGNILVEPGREGRALLTDFGLGRVFEGPQGNLQISRSLELASSGAEVQGTIRYLAPELLRGEAADRRADVYSFGVLLFEVLTGKLPEGREVPSDLARNKIPAALDRMFERTFARLEKRPDSLTPLLAELEELLEGKTSAPKPDAPAPTPSVATPVRVLRAKRDQPLVVSAPLDKAGVAGSQPLRAVPADAPVQAIPVSAAPSSDEVDACWRNKLEAARGDARFRRWRDGMLAHLRSSMQGKSGIGSFDAQGFDLCFGVTREGEPQHRVYVLLLPKLDASLSRAAVAEARRIFDLEKGIWEKEVTFWVMSEDVSERDQVLWTFKSFCMGWWRRRRIVLQDVENERLHASELGCDPRGNHLKRIFHAAAREALASVPRLPEPVRVPVRTRPRRCGRGATWGAGLAIMMTTGLLGSLFALEMASRSLRCKDRAQRAGVRGCPVALVTTASATKSSGAVAPASGAKSSGAVAPASGAKSSGAASAESGAPGILGGVRDMRDAFRRAQRELRYF